jgi:phosphatidylcholine synthase
MPSRSLRGKRSRREPAPEGSSRTGRVRQVLAWGVHFYTALGLVAAAWMAVLILQGGAEAFRGVFALMLVATVIDATDGTLARAVRVKEVLPGFDGRRLDDITDFLTYVFLPLFLLYRARVLPPGWEPFLLAPLLASAYGFCQASVKTDDGYFLGFPSCWNVVAFYLYVLHAYVAPLTPWLSAGILVSLSLLTFVPVRYLYPSQGGRLNHLTTALGVLWSALVVWILWQLPVPAGHSEGTLRILILASLFFPVYYLTVSWAVSWGKRRPRRSSTRITHEAVGG